MAMLIKVKRLPEDDFSRPRYKNVETGAIYADVSLGDGDWCTTSRDGEPCSPLRKDIVFEIIE